MKGTGPLIPPEEKVNVRDIKGPVPFILGPPSGTAHGF